MISPLGQRQVFQIANVEAVRQAHGVSELIERENAKKLVADERMLEDQASVPVISKSEALKTEERREGRKRGQEQLEADQETPERKPEQEKVEEANSAGSADSHLNFLA